MQKNSKETIQLTNRQGHKIFMAGKAAEEVKKRKEKMLFNLSLEADLQDLHLQDEE